MTNPNGRPPKILLTCLSSLGMINWFLGGSKKKGDCLKKNLWLLLTLLLLVGCGGFYPRGNQNSLLPVPPRAQEFSPWPPEGADASPLDLIPKEPQEPEILGHTDAVLDSKTEDNLHSLPDPLPLLTTGVEEAFQSSTANLGSIPLKALETNLWPLDLQPSLPTPKANPSNAGIEKTDFGAPSMLLREVRPEKGEAGAYAGKWGGDLFEKDVEIQNLLESGMSGQEQRQQILFPSETDLVPLTLQPPEWVAREVASGNKSSANFLASFPALLNEKVKQFIDFFQTKADTFFTNSLARSQAYEGMMKKIFRDKNLPEELFYLALIESGFDPNAQSAAKACGIWQFMTKTARRFGLKVDKWVDERRDPEKSTYAAALYLSNLHGMFNCWFLAAAGYNAGEGKILEAMKRANSQDFWEISKYRYLKRETKDYVPMFLAAMIIAQDPQKYGFSPVKYHAPLEYEKVSVPPGTKLDRIARAARAELGEIRALNPSLRRDKTPPDGSSFEIKLPPGKKEVFENNFYKSCKSGSRNGKTHRVRRGETLSQIAKKNRLTVQELCECNQISPKTLLRPGVTLLVPP